MTHHLKGINAVSELKCIDRLAMRFEEKHDDDAAKNLLSSKDCEDGFGEEEIKVLGAWRAARTTAKIDNSSSRKKLPKRGTCTPPRSTMTRRKATQFVCVV